MIAIPSKTNSLDSAVSNHFGKAKWFALISADGDVSYVRNEVLKGRQIIMPLLEAGVKTVIFQDMGEKPMEMLLAHNVNCFYAGDGRVILREVLKAYAARNLLHVNTSNITDFIKAGKCNTEKKEQGKGCHHGEKEQHQHQWAGKVRCCQRKKPLAAL